MSCDRNQVRPFAPSYLNGLPPEYLSHFLLDAAEQRDLSATYSGYGGECRGRPLSDIHCFRPCLGLALFEMAERVF